MPQGSESSPSKELQVIKPGMNISRNGVDLSKLPKSMDLSAEAITDHVHAINSSCTDERLKFIMNSLVNHLHAFVRETSITHEEWTTAIQFVSETGKTGIELVQEYILLSDILGASSLVDIVNNKMPPGATEPTPLGPFFSEHTHHVHSGDSIASEGKGDYLFVEGQVLDLQGKPIPGAIIDTWETDGDGRYDAQYEGHEPECRGRLQCAKDGSFSFRAVQPVSYPIPVEGLAGNLLEKLGRHPYRPEHLHFRIEAPGYKTLITALYWKNSDYITSDAVFGVRKSLLIKPETIIDTQLTLSRGFKEAKPHDYLKYNFVLARPEECEPRVSSPGVLSTLVRRIYSYFSK